MIYVDKEIVKPVMVGTINAPVKKEGYGFRVYKTLIS